MISVKSSISSQHTISRWWCSTFSTWTLTTQIRFWWLTISEPCHMCVRPINIDGLNRFSLVICYIAIENDPVKIVDFPMKQMVIFHNYVSHYQSVSVKYDKFWYPKIPKMGWVDWPPMPHWYMITAKLIKSWFQICLYGQSIPLDPWPLFFRRYSTP